MARIRTVKPEFWTSEQVVECSPIARLMFIGMWNFCDDHGNHPASYKTLKMEVFPGDDISTSEIEIYVNELLKNELIVKYDGGNGREYWHVTGWHHQKIDKVSAKHPPFDPLKISKFDNHSTTIRQPLDNPSTPEGKGREGNSKGKEDNPFVSPFPQKQDEVVDAVSPKAQQKKVNGTRLPDDFEMPDDWINWALNERKELTMEIVVFERDKFIDYWHSSAGAKARKIDWLATWRNWIRNCMAQPPPTNRSPQPKNKRFDPINAINGGDGYGNAREQENRIIDIGGGVAEEEQQRHLGYRSSF